MTARERWTGALGLIAVVLLAVAPVGCDKERETKTSESSTSAPVAEESGPLAAPVIPRPAGKLTPAFTTLPDGAHYDVDVHADIETCTECHSAVVEQWRSSAHGLSSLHNPYFRTSFDEFVKEAGREKARFCAGCHDPTLLFDGAIERPVEPTEARAHIGITCNTCHGIDEATVDGNASYRLDTSHVPLPEEGKPETLAKHIQRVGGTKLRTNELCVSCHRGFLSADTGHSVLVEGVDEFTSFHRSPYNGVEVSRIDDVEPQNCVDCHMPEVEVDGKMVRSHRFPGGHTTLAAAIGDDAQLEANIKMIKEAADLDIAGWGTGKFGLEKPEELEAGDELWADVVVFNDKVGHMFPGGAADLRDTWVEFVLKDADGVVLASAGTAHEESGADESAHVLRALVGDVEGTDVELHQVVSFRAPVYDHRVAPRGAQVVRYGWKVPESADIKHPVTMEAALRHRRLTRTLYEETCKRSKTELGHKWRAETKFRTGLDLDACVEQPVVEIARATAQIGGDERSPQLDEWTRHYRWGIGLQDHVSESLDEAKVVFEKAKQAADPANKERVGMTELVLGQVAARQGRRQHALDHFARAENLIGEHPAIEYARGVAHQRTFHNEEASEAFKTASKHVHDDRIWRQLAISSGSVFMHRQAYDAAQEGLKISPRDPHLLRSQSLSAAKLDVAEEQVKAAREAFLTFRRDELAPEIRVRCSEASPTCERERVPVHVHPLTAPEGD